jgi:hypothetical protein
VQRSPCSLYTTAAVNDALHARKSLQCERLEKGFMYEAFDKFLTSHTWHSGKDGDRRRFYVALNEVVHEPAFDPEQMGDYMRAKFGVAAGSADSRDTAIAQRTNDAWAVRDFLAATGVIKG